MEALQSKTLGQLVSIEPATALVFEKYGLDFCCKGKRTIDEACLAENLNAEDVKRDVAHVFSNKNIVHNPDHFDHMELDHLVEHIIHKHHAFVKSILPVLQQHTQKVADVHGENHPEVIEVAALFHELKIEFDQHMFKEEQVLFPYIKKLVHAKNENDHHSFPKIHFVANPISVMEEEHEYAGNIMAKIHRLTNGFTPPASACTTYRLTYHELHEFEKDLHQHVHLENNILFPKSKALENVLNKIAAN